MLCCVYVVGLSIFLSRISFISFCPLLFFIYLLCKSLHLFSLCFLSFSLLLQIFIFMDKIWMYSKSRGSDEYITGVNTFLEFASQNIQSIDGKISCPCVKCFNTLRFPTHTVFNHLLRYGFQHGYDKWIYHGENNRESDGKKTESTCDALMYQTYMIIFFSMISLACYMMHSVHMQLRWMILLQINFKKYFRMQKKSVYPKSKYSMFTTIVHLYHLKCLSG